MALSDKLATKVYAEGTAGTKASRFAKIIAQSGIQETAELLRIARLPRRDWQKAPDLAEMTREATLALKTPGGSMSLWLQQAAALRDFYDVKGLFAPVSVGAGKTLVTLLAPTLVESERPVLLIPAGLRDQTVYQVIPEMRAHWKLHRNLMVIGYEELGLEKNSELLETLRPDLIIADEAHMVKTMSAGRTRRLVRYMRANPATIFVALSGTATKRSIRDYHHLLLWSLKPDLCPLPANWRELQDWADVLDERPPENRVVHPGALKVFCATTIDKVTQKERPETPREGYKRRLHETPGVIASDDQEIGASLQILERKLVPPENILRMMVHMRAFWETPNGDEITEAMDLWRYMRELACGFFYRWDPMPPKEWLDARRAWNKYVRETLKTNRRGLDTPLQVWKESSKAPHTEWIAWNEIRETFKINTVPQWESDFLVDDAAKWLNDHPKNGIVWTEFDAVGEAIAKKSKRPYFGGGSNASRDIRLAEGSIIASIKAHGTGKNLQRYSANLVTSPPPTGLVWQQMMGRTHRPGQEADTCTNEVYIFAPELQSSIRRAKSDARYIEETGGGGRQKLNYADWGFRV